MPSVAMSVQMIVPGAGGLGLYGERGGFHCGEFRPALDGDLAVFGVDADGDPVAAKVPGELRHEIEGLGGPGADDDAGDAGIEGALRRGLVADAAAKLARDADGGVMRAIHPRLRCSPVKEASRSMMWR